MRTTQIECPECAGALALPADVMEGEILSCDECGVEWEVVGGEPLSVVRAPEVEEDWGE